MNVSDRGQTSSEWRVVVSGEWRAGGGERSKCLSPATEALGIKADES